MQVFVLMHLNMLDEDTEDVKMIGVYSSYAAAEQAVNRVKVQPGFCDAPGIRNPTDVTDTEESGFYISGYELDKDHWTTGFVTMCGDQEIKPDLHSSQQKQDN